MEKAPGEIHSVIKLGEGETPSQRRNLKFLFFSIFGVVLGLYLPRLIRFVISVFNQPPLMERSRPIPKRLNMLEDKAYQIAVENLEEGLEVRQLEDGTEKLILCAGVRNFREPWARDTGFALFGLLEMARYAAARDALEVFLLTQAESGQFPVKIHSTGVVERFFYSLFKRTQPIVKPIRPKYITAHNTVSLDGNCLLVIAIMNYAVRSGDLDFPRKYWEHIKFALGWLENYVKDEDGLLHQDVFTDWADTVARQGKILYTNVLYWKALQETAEMAASLESLKDATFFGQKAATVRASINDQFWRPDMGYYITSQVFDNLSSSGNLLAIAWELTTPQQANDILDAMRFYGMAVPVPTKAVHRAYPRKFIAIENRLGGIADYHTYFAWLWLGAWHVIALARMERMEEARELLYNISRVIVRDGAVHEVYAPSGNYASNIWYTSESPLTWSAGMFVHAYHVLMRHGGYRNGEHFE
jgi:GH15 family glucan-1,4-alpha-glucosidase